jgi:hypothetical protein
MSPDSSIRSLVDVGHAEIVGVVDSPMATVGERTARNVIASGRVSCRLRPRGADHYSLIVGGLATVASSHGGTQLFVAKSCTARSRCLTGWDCYPRALRRYRLWSGRY